MRKAVTLDLDECGGYCTKHFVNAVNEVSGENFTINDIVSYDPFKWTNAKGKLKPHHPLEAFYKIAASDIYKEMEQIEGFSQLTHKLKNDGYEISIITARIISLDNKIGKYVQNLDFYKKIDLNKINDKMENDTIDWLKKQDIEYNNIIFKRNKTPVIQSLDPLAHLDDAYKNLVNLECYKILMNTTTNEQKKSTNFFRFIEKETINPEQVIRVYNHLQTYDAIKKIEEHVLNSY